ncbi:divergent polysaccharide deacetylase family protein [Frigidibacter sp. RF13]|uniref:divergent polysaccharide deacetylase family protein n=1 Tax=Frigidibacter sp. RF13 TaxID=2997340 RepID=UPI00226DD442|nr:divergent polysaccharide deacetylase family protein [Frigidibacter sp. RF13]MCY1125231.1 divergent polysaccharide deacetylase family protein [Frigidibacter sp. RF13]
MSRSYVAGSVTGVVLSLVGFGVISTVAPPPTGHQDHNQAPEETAVQVPEAVAPVTETTEADAPAAPESADAGAPEAAILDVPEGSEFDAAKGDTVAALPEAEPAPEAEADQASAAPAAEPAPALSETTPPAAPDSGPVASLQADQTVSEGSAPDLPAAEVPIAEPSPAATLAAPEGTAHASGAGQQGGPPSPGQSIDIALAEPADQPTEDAAAATDAPSTSAEAQQEEAPTPAAAATGEMTNDAEADAEAEPEAQAMPVTAPAEAATEPAVEAPSADAAAPVEPASDTVAEAAPSVDPAQEPAPEPEPAPQPSAEPETGASPEVVAEPGPEAAPEEPAALPASDPEVTAEPASEPAPEDSGKPKILTLDPATAPEGQGTAALGREVPGVKILRPPTADAADESSAAEAKSAEEGLPDTASEAMPDGQVPPLKAYAAAFENPDARPPLAVIILDVGTAAGGLDPSALAALPFAATVAVDPLAPDAADRETALRSAGAEVAIFAGDLPQGATPADMEVAYQSYVQALPHSVALIGLPGAAFQKQSLDAQHMAALLATDGRGFITFAQGLNAARRAAEKAGAPVASVDRLITVEDAKGGALARELDKLAFSAAQKGSAVIAIPSTAEAITGLIAWSGSNAAGSVALAPVSALMNANGG